MEKIKLIGIITIIPLLWGCIIKEENIYPYYPLEPDTIPPSAPRGLYSVTGDRKVYLYFLPNPEKDLAGYFIWRGFSYEGPYEKIANLPPSRTSFIDYNVQNGITYYYAVSAYDTAGNESELSSEVVFDTPRPDGEDVLWSYLIYPDFSGFDFSNQSVCSYLSPSCDFYYEYDTLDKVGYIIVPDTLTWVQDMGYAESFDEIGYAPTEGWSKLGILEAIKGHIYVFWTGDNHFAKIRILNSENRLVFEWAYQIDEGNRELSLPFEGLKPLKIK